MKNLADLKNIQLWILIPMEKRMKIRAEHDIPRSGKSVIADCKIQQDGILEKDLEDFPKGVLLSALDYDFDQEDEKNEEEKTGEKIKKHEEEVEKVEEKTTTNKYIK